MKRILKSIDACLQKYIGLDEQEVIPDILKINDSKIFLINTESHKRHTYTHKIDQFLSANLKNLSTSTKEKLGVSLGEALAKNLIITFDEVIIKKEKNNA